MSSETHSLARINAHETAPLPAGAAEAFLTANGVRLHYVTAGDGPLVLLLHGFPEFWYSWRSQLPVLAAAGRRMVALDMRGYNLSDKPTYGYDVASLAADVREAIVALGEHEADVVGHDWGGVIAWAVALREPDYLRRLVILNAPHPGLFWREIAHHPRQLLKSAYVGFFQLRGLAEGAIRRDDFASVRRTFRRADPGRAWLSDDDIQRYVAAIARPGALAAALEYYRRLLRTGPAPFSPTRVIQAPALVLWGELDPYIVPEMADGLDRWCRDVRVRRFPTAGHWLNQQEPERVNEELVSFLAQKPAR